MLRVRMLFWEESEDEQGEVGSFVLRDGSRVVEIDPVTPDAPMILGRILQRELRTKDGRRIPVAQNPELWMRSLPMNYDGAYVRAELEES